MARTKGATNKPRPALKGKPCSMEFLFRCMQDTELEIRDRIDCAKAILPYQHRKQPMAVEGSIDGTLEIIIRGQD
jgi:hypothetical protein